VVSFITHSKRRSISATLVSMPFILIYQGAGIGLPTYRHVLEIMRTKGMKYASVGTGGDPSCAPARRA
jgi:hypothetical protein